MVQSEVAGGKATPRTTRWILVHLRPKSVDAAEGRVTMSLTKAFEADREPVQTHAQLQIQSKKRTKIQSIHLLQSTSGSEASRPVDTWIAARKVQVRNEGVEVYPTSTGTEMAETTTIVIDIGQVHVDMITNTLVGETMIAIGLREIVAMMTGD